MRETTRTARRRARSAVAVAGAAALVGLSGSPAAAGTAARASGTAVRITVAGTPEDSGSFRSTHDGGREQTSGSNRPAVGLLGGQDLVTAGTLAQDARTRVQGGRGFSEACAGLAGDGATVVGVGDGTCLRGGENLRLEAGSLDLSGLEIVEGDLPLPAAPEDSSAPLDQSELDQSELDQSELEAVTEALDAAVDRAVAALGDPGLFVDLGAVQSRCAAGPGTAEGSASIAGAGAYVQLPDRRIDLVSLPVAPAPNTKVVTDLGAVAEAVRTAVDQQLRTGLDGALAPLGDAVDQAAVIEGALDQVSAQLAPLEQNVLDLTLNKQVRPSADAITVTALDAQLLPAAAEQLGSAAFSLQVGESACGPSGRVAAPQPAPGSGAAAPSRAGAARPPSSPPASRTPRWTPRRTACRAPASAPSRAWSRWQ